MGRPTKGIMYAGETRVTWKICKSRVKINVTHSKYFKFKGKNFVVKSDKRRATRI